MSTTISQADRDDDLREALRDALNFALANSSSSEHWDEADRIVESFQDYYEFYSVLRDVAETFGPKIYGAVMLHALKNGTELKGFATTCLGSESLSKLGITMRDLGWPQDEYEWAWRDEGLINGDNEVEPSVDFAAAEARAAELGYNKPEHRALVEASLVRARMYGRNGPSTARRNGIEADDWPKILDAFYGIVN